MVCFHILQAFNIQVAACIDLHHIAADLGAYDMCVLARGSDKGTAGHDIRACMDYLFRSSLVLFVRERRVYAADCAVLLVVRDIPKISHILLRVKKTLLYNSSF